jgi:hypothetical protein
MKEKKKREPKAYLIENGVKTVFKYEKTTDRLSSNGIWRQEHPNFGEILDMRAVLK